MAGSKMKLLKLWCEQGITKGMLYMNYTFLSDTTLPVSTQPFPDQSRDSAYMGNVIYFIDFVYVCAKQNVLGIESF